MGNKPWLPRVPEFLQSGPKSLGILGKKKTQQMEERRLKSVSPVAVPVAPEGLKGPWNYGIPCRLKALPGLERVQDLVLVSVSVCWGQALGIGVPLSRICGPFKREALSSSLFLLRN